MGDWTIIGKEGGFLQREYVYASIHLQDFLYEKREGLVACMGFLQIKMMEISR